MKNLTKTNLKTIVMAMIMVMSTISFAFAAGPDFNGVVAPVVDLLNAILGPMLLVVGAVGALYCVLLGVKYARAEEPQDREKAKAHLKSAIIGFVLIFVLIVVLNLLLPVLTKWASQYQTTLQIVENK